MEKKYMNIIHHLEGCLEKYGDSHLGVEWPNFEDTQKRYKIMLDLMFMRENNAKQYDLLDFGCGASHLYDYILKHNLTNINYTGLDISKDFYNFSKKKFPQNEYYCLDILDENVTIRNFDYIVLNGVFTEKLDLSFDEMFEYFKKLILRVMDIANIGIAFNVMSKDVDWERDDLFHLPMNLLSEFLTKQVSRNFIIRNDYGLYEYTTYVYKP